MKHLVLGSVALLALAAAGPAVAADMRARAPVYKAPPAMVAAHNWTGFYVGGHLGGALSDNKYALDIGTIEAFTHDPSSWIGGAHVGAQGQWGNLVFGIEGTYSWTDLNSTVGSILLPGRLRSLTINSVATIVGKLGIPSTNWLFYVKGGWAIADIDTFAINPATSVSASTSGTENGWTLGAGIDYMVTSNWIIGVDFNYYQFDFNRSTLATDGTPTRYFDTDSDIYTIMGRVSYKFDWGKGPVTGKGPLVTKY